MSADESLAAGALWARVSHDLRQPLQSLLLLSHVMALSDDQTQRQATARSMEASLEALQSMLDTLATVAKLESGLLLPQPSVIALGPMIASVVAELSAASNKRKLEFVVACELTTITADPALLRLVLNGMAWNGAKLARPGPVEIRCATVDRSALFEFQFDGAAPTAAQRNAMFIEVRRGNASTGSAPGLGLLSAFAKHLNWTLSYRTQSAARQSLTLALPM